MPARARESVAVVYEDNYTSSNLGDKKIPLLPKANRLNRYASSIFYQGDGLDDNVKKCVEYALDVWESSIWGNDSIYLEIRVDDIDSDISTEVSYCVVSGCYLPHALYRHVYNVAEEDEIMDGIITINSKTKWDYSIGENMSVDGKNLTFGLMRAIARVLGFGSSVKMTPENEYYFCLKRGYSLFDKLVTRSDGAELSSVNLNGGEPNVELKNYITSSSAFTFNVNANGESFQLQSPPYSPDVPPFTYLSDNTSLMCGNLNEGSYVLQVDQPVLSVLGELGWQVHADWSNPVKIIGENVQMNGIVSAYTTHSFRVEKGAATVSRPEWQLTLPLADGQQKVYTLPDMNLKCNVYLLGDESMYKRNINGDIEGKLDFSCYIDGKKVYADPFKLFFELKPFVESATIEKIVDNYPYSSYDAHYQVKYFGADNIMVSVEEEFGSVLKTWILRESYIAKGVADHITSLCYAWIDFTAENEYGKSVYTIELQPYGVVVNSFSSDCQTAGHGIGHAGDSVDIFRIYDMLGNELGVMENLSGLQDLDYSGIIIIRQFRDNECINTFKRRL